MKISSNEDVVQPSTGYYLSIHSHELALAVCHILLELSLIIFPV
jgi:hypothetical protein